MASLPAEGAHVVKTGDELSRGSKELIFIAAQMLHWLDSMMSCLTKDSILFSATTPSASI